MTWQAGQSGNAAGRPRGTGQVAKLRASIAEHIPGIVAKLVEQAKAGDVGAARLLLERVLPPIKASEQETPIALPEGSLTDQGRAVMAAAGSGEIPPSQAAQLLTGLGALAKLLETDELASRVKALEERSGNAAAKAQ
ncbi:DUF5681 domain-containing protein [Piscinibacter koreensis]|uniref:DUF5681 domain-containing protein n=1 Tax=Piscinibacter koreensis TaxID=2742824 RepID=A0A7Y6NP40_9BURK|nr:hypothetical protein [Schlegelella koreensis]